MSFIFLFLFLLLFSHYYYILNNIHSLPLINISRERTNFDAWGYWRFYTRYYRGRAYSLTNAWNLDFLPWNWCRNHVLSTRVVRKNYFFVFQIFFMKNNLFYFKSGSYLRNGLVFQSPLPDFSPPRQDPDRCQVEEFLHGVV